MLEARLPAMQNQTAPLREDRAKFYAAAVICGLEYMHERSLCWRYACELPYMHECIMCCRQVMHSKRGFATDVHYTSATTVSPCCALNSSYTCILMGSMEVTRCPCLVTACHTVFIALPTKGTCVVRAVLVQQCLQLFCMHQNQMTALLFRCHDSCARQELMHSLYECL